MDSVHKQLSIPLKTPQFPAQLSPEFMFYGQCCRVDADHAIGICRLGKARRKLGVACPLFSFFNKIHDRHKIDTYRCNFRHVREPYLARLGPNGSFSYQRARRAYPALKSKLGHSYKSRHSGSSIPFVNRIHCKHKLDRYISSFCGVRQP